MPNGDPRQPKRIKLSMAPGLSPAAESPTPLMRSLSTGDNAGNHRSSRRDTLTSERTAPGSGKIRPASLPPSIVSYEPLTRKNSSRRFSLASRLTTGDQNIPVLAYVSPRPSSVREPLSEYHLRDPTISRQYGRMTRWDDTPTSESNLHWYVFAEN